MRSLAGFGGKSKPKVHRPRQWPQITPRVRGRQSKTTFFKLKKKIINQFSCNKTGYTSWLNNFYYTHFYWSISGQRLCIASAWQTHYLQPYQKARKYPTIIPITNHASTATATATVWAPQTGANPTWSQEISCNLYTKSVVL